MLTQQAYDLMPRVKITDLLLEVGQWTDFTRHFTHLKSGAEPPERTLLLTAILADAFNLGLEKMADACPGTSREAVVAGRLVRPRRDLPEGARRAGQLSAWFANTPRQRPRLSSGRAGRGCS
ncbi:hypothetical protein OKW30_003496 [Paraburkholderia sp. Clong3]